MKERSIVIFIIPSLAGFLIFFLIPFAGSFGYAFNDGGGFGFSNFYKTFGNQAFHLSFWNTIRFMLICVPLNLVLPLLLAIAVRYLGEESRLFKLAAISPMVVPVASVSVFWLILFAPNGTVGNMLTSFGLKDVDILNGGWALPALALIYLWKNLGYIMILYLVGLGEIPKSYYEAAALDGAGGIRSFFKITIPNLQPTIFFVLVISVMNCFKVFREIYLLSGSYPHESVYMLQHYMNNMFAGGDYPMLTAAALIITIVIVIFILTMFYMNRRSHKNLYGD